MINTILEIEDALFELQHKFFDNAREYDELVLEEQKLLQLLDELNHAPPL